jgi:hypothetical protein
MGSDAGGDRAAAIYSLVETAKCWRRPIFERLSFRSAPTGYFVSSVMTTLNNWLSAPWRHLPVSPSSHGYNVDRSMTFTKRRELSP